MTTLEKKEILRRLRNLKKALGKHTQHLNHGGCGVLAYMVGRELEEFHITCDVATYDKGVNGVPASIARHGVRGSQVDDPAEWDRNGLSRAHLAIRFRLEGKSYIWDSGGLYHTARFGLSMRRAAGTLGDGLTVAECAAISKTGKGWNPWFNRAQIPLMQHLVLHHLKYGL